MIVIADPSCTRSVENIAQLGNVFFRDVDFEFDFGEIVHVTRSPIGTRILAGAIVATRCVVKDFVQGTARHHLILPFLAAPARTLVDPIDSFARIGMGLRSECFDCG